MFKLEDKNLMYYGNIEDLEDLPYINSGSRGDLYKFEIDGTLYALKVFNEDFYNITYANEYLKDYERFKTINIDSYISPIKLLFINGDFNGYLMKYCKGKDLKNRKLDIKLDNYIESVKKLYSDTEKLSEMNFLIYDLDLANAMYDDGFKIIDLDDYFYDDNRDFNYINNKNIIEINKLMIKNFIKSTGIEYLAATNKSIKKLINYCLEGELTFEEFVNIILNYTKKIDEEEINKTSDVGKVLTKYPKKIKF